MAGFPLRHSPLRHSPLACFTVPFFADLVVIARSLYPIPSRTRPSKSSAPMVLNLKVWKSRSLPGLPRAELPHHEFSSKKAPRSPRGFLFARAPVMSRMPSDLLLRCRCGHIRGVAREMTPSAGFRFICYCKDCQAFARFLDRPDVLDQAGGTDIFQVAAASVKLTAGVDALRCLSFSGKVLRWHADCCRTPLANTAATARLPVVALIHSFMDRNEASDLSPAISSKNG